MASRDAKLNIEITASGSKAKAEIQGVENAVKKLGSSATGFQKGFQGAASTASNFAGIFTGDRLTGATSQLTSLAGAVGAIPGPLGLATGAAAGLTAATAGLGAALFKLTNDAAEYGSKIHDAAVQTGLGAESISAFKIAADQSGTSLEQLTGGLAKFAKTVGSADSKKLSTLGLKKEDLADIDAAFGKFVKRIGEAPSGIKQMELANLGMGRSGAALIPLFEQMGYNTDAYRKKMEALGLTIGRDTANQADEFGDQMVILKAQLEAVGRTIGFELMPVFKNMADGMSSWLAQNKGQIQSWGTYTADILRGVGVMWDKATESKNRYWGGRSDTEDRSGIGELSKLSRFSPWGILAMAGEGAREKQQQREAAILAGMTFSGGSSITDTRKNLPSAYELNKGWYGNDGEGKGSGGKGGSTKKAKLDIPALGSMSTLVISSGHPDWDAWFVEMGAKFHVDPNVLLLQANRESGGRANARSPKGAQGFSQFMPGTAARFNVNTSSVKDSIRGQAQYMAVLLSMFGGDYKKALAGYNAGEGNVQKYGGVPPFRETQGYVSGIASAYAGKVRKGTGGYGTYNQDAMDAKAQEEEFEGLKKAWDEYLAFEKQSFGEELDMRRLEADLAVEILQKQLREQEIDEVEYAEKIGQLKIDMLEEEEANLAKLTPTHENLVKLQQIDLEIEKARLEKEKGIAEAVERQNQAFLNQLDALDKLQKKNQRPGLKTRVAGIEGMDDGFAKGLFGGIGESRFTSQADMMTRSLQKLGDIGGQAVTGLADAMGSLVENWILYGAAGENAAQKALASVLAMASRQALVSAIMETAYGIAALTPWGAAIYGPAALHFKSAAMFGLVAAGTGLLGRAVAGDSFKQGKASGSAGGYGSGSVNSDPATYSRVSEGAYRSGTNNHMYALLNRSINSLRDKITSMRPGDVLVRGANERRGFIGEQTVRDVRANSGTGKNLGRAMGIS